MNINLTPQLEELVRSKVAGGLYNNASEVVREALRLMEARDRAQAPKLEQLRNDIEAGLASGDAGDLDGDAIKQRGRTRMTTKPVKR
jgi:antitoxin ParD1/3/4